MAEPKRQMMNEALSLARMYWGYSQAEMADALGMSQAMVSEIERGAKSVTLETLDRYSTALGVKKSQLMFFAEEIEGQAPVRKGRLIIAEKALTILRKLKPIDAEDATAQ
ncbi:helix-turn-helix transcriptional regulator [Alisedimentitalea sp. MJ-SS2]|uniref:helix-turn-helix domain-containing protein n=1 Tax=Aliisedimentitalea sp. MJ-SS2 TaxID=3049795 RepID=UPI00290EB14B|nr:helix-turn-helix transcriptional regulator [Alisedimentitalea sp. MJ-SS2]MDU8928223.1 helix-turn-helix transcriptional regulator [Alisedimentitalea sp. MJ-SS2]